MIVDFHYHAALGPLPQSTSRAMPRGCILAQDAADNAGCLQTAAAHEIACGLFAHPRSSDWHDVIRLVSTRRALAYQHLELVERQDLAALEPLLAASQASGLPIILHLSRHDRTVFSESEAVGGLSRMLERFPELRVIVSHCGGENVLAVVQAAKACPRVLLDTSCIAETSERSSHEDPRSLLEFIADQVPPRQLLYGSDQTWPRYADAPNELTWLSSVFPTADLEQICTANGAAILRDLAIIPACQ